MVEGLFQKLIGGQIADRVLARLTLKGNYIWSSKSDETPVYLDGDVFGVNRSNRIDLHLPSGDKRRGGDFEMWFWLTPPSEATSGIVLTVGVSGTTVNGTVQDSSGALIPAVPVTLTNVATGAVRQAVTDTAGRYQFGNVQPGTYQVTAVSGGQTAQKTVAVQG